MPTDPVSRILEDQVIHLKRGRLNGLGFEPAFNSYFDFYVSPKYIDPPLIKLEDVGFHLFLRKNLNDLNPQWKMPTIRQMMYRLDVSQRKIEAIMLRLDSAHLLRKESGYRAGEDGENIRNGYILSDPIQTLDEFLFVASTGRFGRELKPEWLEVCSTSVDPCTRDAYTPVRESDTDPVREERTYKQTSFLKTEDVIWVNVLGALKAQLPANTFYSFIADTKFLRVDMGIALILFTRNTAVDWIERQLSKNIAKLINLEWKLLDPETAVKVEGIRCVVEGETDR